MTWVPILQNYPNNLYIKFYLLVVTFIFILFVKNKFSNNDGFFKTSLYQCLLQEEKKKNKINK